MPRFELELKLDNLLSYFVKHGTNHLVSIHMLPFDVDIQKMVSILSSRGFIAPPTITFDSGPIVMHNVVSVTPAGIWFNFNSGFVKEAEQTDKEQKRFNFEYWKLGWDTIVAGLAFIISLISLYISTR